MLLLMTAAAITVNKSVFGHRVDTIGERGVTLETEDSIVTLSDGSTVIHTADLSGMINGYAGPVNMDIHIADGKISEITPLPNAETPSFFKRASVLFDSWIGKTPREGMDMQVDAISGATYSSNAIINNMKTGLSFYEGGSVTTSTSTPWKIWVALAVTISACIIPLFVRNKLYHTIQLCANIVVLGFWCGQFLDYAMILKYISGGFSFPVGLSP